MGVEIMCAIVWNSDANATFISTTDPAGNINFWSQPEGGTTWPAPQLVGTPLFEQGRFNIYREPTMSWGSNKAPVVIAAVDFLGNLDYFFRPHNTSVWHQQHVAATATDGGIVYGEPAAIVWADTGVALAVSDISGGLLKYWWQAKGAQTWSPPQVVAQAQQPAIAWTGDFVVITAVDPEGNLLYWQLSPGTTAFNPPQTVASARRGVRYSQPAIWWTGGAVVIAAVDSVGNLYYWVQLQNSIGASWPAPGLVASASGGVGYSKPSIAWSTVRQNHAVLITAVDSAGNLHYWWQPQGATGWNAESVASASLVSGKFDSPAIAWADHTAGIVAKSFDSLGELLKINYWWQPNRATGWNPETVTL
jgi:hypothetical protein